MKEELTIEVGMGATEILHSDRHPHTVIEIKSPTRIIVQADNAERIDKNYASGSQDYLYTANPEGRKTELIKTKRGWKQLHSTTYFAMGMREEYYDYSF